MELISERASAQRLAVWGLSLSAAQQLLRTGVAGQPLITPGVRLYDVRRITDLVERPEISAGECTALFPDGCLVARLSRDRSADATASWPATIPLLQGPWLLGPWQYLAVYCWQRLGRDVPLLVSVEGCVISGAMASGLCPPGESAPAGSVRFDLGPPGPWLGEVTGRMLRLGRGAPVEMIGALAGHRGDRSGRYDEWARR